MTRLLLAAAVPLLAWGTFAVSGTAFLYFVVVLAAWVYLDLAGVLARVAARPVVVVGLVPVVWLPLALAGEPDRGWELIGDVFAASLVLTFLVVLALGRRRSVSVVVGFTLLPALIVGLGAAGLVLLAQLPDGFRWVLGVAVLAAVSKCGPLAARSRVARRSLDRPAGPTSALEVPALVAAGVLVVLAAVALTVLADPPFTPLAVAGAALVVLVLAVVAGELTRGLEEAAAAGGRRRPAGAGAVYGATDALFVAAPAVYILARALTF